MKDISILKKIKNIPDNIAGLDSPEFTGVPTVPTPSDDDNSKQIANTEYVSNKIAADVKIVGDKAKEIENKLSLLDSIDTDDIASEIENELKDKLSDELVDELDKQSIKITYSTMEEREKSIINTVNQLIDIIDKLPADKQIVMATYKSNLQSKRNDLESIFADTYNAYQQVLEGTLDQDAFITKFKNWYAAGEALLLYCQQVINILNRYLVDLKADATQKAIFDLLTDNGRMQGIYYADVVNESTGETERQLFINGEYCQLKGLRVIDNQGTITLDIGKDGTIKMNVVSLTVTGKSISNLVSDSMSSSDVIQNAVDSATANTKQQISDLEKRVGNVESTVKNVNDSVKDAIQDDIISAAEVKTINTLYNELNSRNSAVVDELTGAASLANISSDDKNTLIAYKSSVQNAFSQVTSTYKSIQSNPTTQNFTTFNSKVNDWNNYVGIARAYVQVTLNNITTKITNNKLSATREAVFNALTDNGRLQGIYMSNDQLYINGEYIKTKDLRIENSITTKDLYVQNINSNRVLNKLSTKTRVYVNRNTGTDGIEFKQGAVFKTVQGAINMMPKYLDTTKYALIQLQTDTYEDIEVHSISGGKVCIEMNYHNIYGTIESINNHQVQIFGVDEDTSLTQNDISKFPSIIPYQMCEELGYYSTIYVSKSLHTFIRDVKVHGKLYNAKGETKYTTQNRNYAIMSAYSGCVECSNIAITNSDCGFIAYKGAHVITRNVFGYLTKYGYYAIWGGFIDICRTRAVGAPTNYTKYDAESINVGTNVTFDSKGVSSANSTSGTNSQNSVVSSDIITAYEAFSLSYRKQTSDNLIKWEYGFVNGVADIDTTVRSDMGDTSSDDTDNVYAFWCFNSTEMNRFKGKTLDSITLTFPIKTFNNSNQYVPLVYHNINGSEDSLITGYCNLSGRQDKTSNNSWTSKVTDPNNVYGKKLQSDWSLDIPHNSLKVTTTSSGKIGTYTILNNTSNKSLFDAIYKGSIKGLGLYSGFDKTGKYDCGFYQALSIQFNYKK